MSREELFAVHGDLGAIDDNWRVARGKDFTRYSWARAGVGYSAGTHTWRLRVRRALCLSCS